MTEIKKAIAQWGETKRVLKSEPYKPYDCLELRELQFQAIEVGQSVCQALQSTEISTDAVDMVKDLAVAQAALADALTTAIKADRLLKKAEIQWIKFREGRKWDEFKKALAMQSEIETSMKRHVASCEKCKGRFEKLG